MLPVSLPAIFVFSFAVTFGAVISPGPVSTAIVSQSPRKGWLVGPLVAAGHAVLELMMAVLILVGLGSGLATAGMQTFIALLGGLLLAWMGFSMLVDVGRGRIRLPGPNQKAASMTTSSLIGLGAVATISNPFWYAWWVTVAAGYLAEAQAASLGAVSAFFLGHISADFAWDTVLSSVVGSGRRWLNDRLYQGIFLLCGAFFLYLAWTFLAQGVSGIAKAGLLPAL